MKKLLVVLALLALALAGAAYWAFPPSSGHSEEGFQTVAVERGLLADVVNATGMLQTDDVALVTSKVAGVVTAIKGDLNQSVKEGEVLLNLYRFKATKEVELAELDVAKAKAFEHGAQAAVEKWDKLGRLSIGSEKELEKARTDLEAAKAVVQEAITKLDMAKEHRELTDVTAPIGGTIIDKKVFIGQPVGPVSLSPSTASAKTPGSLSGNGPLFIIAKDLSKLQVHAQVGEGDIAKIHAGQRATFTVYAYSDTNVKFNGTVRQISDMPTNVQGAVFYDVVIDADNRRDPRTKEWMLRLGMTATVDIVHNEHPDVWKMPLAALNFQLEEHYQGEAAKAKIKSWEGRPDADEWQHVWILDKDKKPLPIFVRTGGRDPKGEAGITDGKFKEVLEWDHDVQAPEPKDPGTFPRVLISAPPYQKPGLFDRPTSLKFS